MIFDPNPPADVRVPYPIVRCSQGSTLNIVVVTERWVGLPTHYWGGHTVWCPGEDVCKACLSGQIKRWQGYVLAHALDEGPVAIVHLTNLAAFMILEYTQNDLNIFALKIQLMRGKKAANSPLIATVHGRKQGVKKLPMKALETTVQNIYRKNGSAPLFER